MSTFTVHKEVGLGNGRCLQLIDENASLSYRFAWKGSDGQYLRGSPTFNSTADILSLLSKASEAGWLGQPENRQSELELRINRKFRAK